MAHRRASDREAPLSLLGFENGSWTPANSRMRSAASLSIPSLSIPSSSSKKRHKADGPKVLTKLDPPPDSVHGLPSRITMEIYPGKKGGEFELPGKARLVLREGEHAKKDVITVALIPASKRHEDAPELKSQQRLVSNIYLIHAKPDLKKPLLLELPKEAEDGANIVALHKVDGKEWHEIHVVNTIDDASGFPIAFVKDKLTIVTCCTGYFVLMQTPLTETLEITPNGGLLHSKIHNMITLRIPKRSSDFSGICRLTIYEAISLRLARGRSLHPRLTNPVISVSNFYDFTFPTYGDCLEFKRAVTLKLPLPTWYETAEEESEDCDAKTMEVLVKHSGKWETLNSPLKITKSSVAFDTKLLGKFCIVEPRKGLKMCLHRPMQMLEMYNEEIGGDILIFAIMDEHVWHLWVELVRLSRVMDTISRHVKKGFTYLRKIPKDKAIEPNRRHTLTITRTAASQMFRNSTFSMFQRSSTSTLRSSTVSRFQRIRTSTKPTTDTDDESSLFLKNGLTFKIEIEGDLRFKTSDDGKETSSEVGSGCIYVQYHELFDDNYRCIEIEPLPAMQSSAYKSFIEEVEARRRARRAEEDEEEEKEEHGKVSNSHRNGTARPTKDPYTAPLPSPTEGNSGCMKQKRISSEDTMDTGVSDDDSFSLVATVKCSIAPQSDQDESSHSQGDPPKPSPAEDPVARFPISIDAEDVYQYYKFEEPPEVDPKAEAAAKAKAEAEEKAREAREARAAAAAAAAVAEEKEKEEARNELNKAAKNSFQRLTTSKKAPTKIVKESKVLTGRSLQVLSRSVPHGLTLAVHLNLPDSVITGIGFDSLSSLTNLTDVTYKILLHWKRQYSVRERESMVTDLLTALKAMELNEVAAIVADRHRNNMELTPGCFNY